MIDKIISQGCQCSESLNSTHVFDTSQLVLSEYRKWKWWLFLFNKSALTFPLVLWDRAARNVRFSQQSGIVKTPDLTGLDECSLQLRGLR